MLFKYLWGFGSVKGPCWMIKSSIKQKQRFKMLTNAQYVIQTYLQIYSMLTLHLCCYLQVFYVFSMFKIFISNYLRRKSASCFKSIQTKMKERPTNFLLTVFYFTDYTYIHLFHLIQSGKCLHVTLSRQMTLSPGH